MYTPESIISVFYGQYILFIGLSVFISFLLYLGSKNQNLGLIDPLNFFWVFTFGTSYAVVIQLFLNGMITEQSLLLILYFFMVLVVSWYLGFNLKIINFGFKKINFNLSSKNIGFILLIFFITYFLLALFYAININWNTFFISRFDANKGFGFLARILDVIRLFVISLSVVKILDSNKGKGIKWFFLLIFILFSSFLNGAKFSILESAYLVLITLSLKTGNIIRLKLKNVLNFSFFSISILLFAVIFTNKLAQKINYNSQYTNLSPGVEMFVSRVIANGDMYYLSLPNDILFKVKGQTSNFFELILKPYLGNDLTAQIFSHERNFESLNIGRAIWEYWFPYSMSGGSTDHFDLAAYSYLNIYGGTLLVICIGFFIGRVNKFKFLSMKKNLNFFALSFFSIIYVKSYLLLLSPVVGITTMLDVLIIFVLYFFIFRIIQRF